MRSRLPFLPSVPSAKDSKAEERKEAAIGSFGIFSLSSLFVPHIYVFADQRRKLEILRMDRGRITLRNIVEIMREALGSYSGLDFHFALPFYSSIFSFLFAVSATQEMGGGGGVVARLRALRRGKVHLVRPKAQEVGCIPPFDSSQKFNRLPGRVASGAIA